MPQQLRVNRLLDVTGATLLGLGTPYLGAGKVYYVDYTDGIGDDGFEGTNPNYPLKLIQTALNKLRNNKNDYVFILASKDGDAAAVVEYPAAPMYRTHLIGISNPNATFGVVMRVTGEAIDCLLFTATYGEIAGISFGGGGNINKGGIGLSQIAGGWIHDCYFGHSFCGDTPYYGIHHDQPGTNHENTMIEDCWFFGDQNNSGGKLKTDGINLEGGVVSKNLVIRNNVFLGLSGVAINVDASGAIITGNRIALDADTAGAGITLGTSAVGCYVDGNHVSYGEAGTVTNGYTDSAGEDANTWGVNYVASTIVSGPA